MNSGFLLGNYPDLSYSELICVLTRLNLDITLKRPLPQLVISEKTLPIVQILPLLGGTVKAGELWLGSSEDLVNVITQICLSQNIHQACFFSQETGPKILTLAQTVKDQLKLKMHRFRFRFPLKATATAGVGQGWADFVIFNLTPDTVLLFTTRAVQDLSWWTLKDYGRPMINPRVGMLPPKLARILVNLAFLDKNLSDANILDPFCGCGTIAQEALDLGCRRLFCSDLNPKQVMATQKNLDWFIGKINTKADIRVTTKDVMSYLPSDFPSGLTAIVFEGYLGPPDFKAQALPGIVKGLIKMYTGVFKRLYPLLVSGGRLVAALPTFIDPDDNLVHLNPLIDTCEKLGYTLIDPPLVVGRPSAHTKREIYQLLKT